MAPKSSITGFDPQAFARAAGPVSGDPWARREAWRYSGPFTRWNRFRGALPGLAWGTGAFVVYTAYELIMFKDDHGHGDSHGSGHGH